MVSVIFKKRFITEYYLVTDIFTFLVCINLSVDIYVFSPRSPAPSPSSDVTADNLQVKSSVIVVIVVSISTGSCFFILLRWIITDLVQMHCC